MSVFEDQTKFMVASDQSVDYFNSDQFNLYVKLINEEYTELNDAIENNDHIEMLDALVDLLVVVIGAINSMGADGEGAWNEVMQTNFAKIDAETGKVCKREDGKILKPANWFPPVLHTFLSKK